MRAVRDKDGNGQHRGETAGWASSRALGGLKNTKHNNNKKE